MTPSPDSRPIPIPIPIPFPTPSDSVSHVGEEGGRDDGTPLPVSSATGG